MHRYEPMSPELDWRDLRIEDREFADALDVVSWAERDRTLGWKTWPEVWHLDDRGRFHCYYKASSLSSLQRWADDPSDLYRSRAEGLRDPDGCTERWLIVDSRPARLSPPPTEADVAAFSRVREALGSIDVLLLDAVVFDDGCHWWSMWELVTGTTRWPEPARE